MEGNALGSFSNHIITAKYCLNGILLLKTRIVINIFARF